jgi:hypothetical protein
MIDPITAFATLSAGHSAIMKGIKMGKDLSSLSNAVSKYASGEAELQFGASYKKKSRFSIAEDSAIEKHFKKERLDDMRKELRSMFQLYGKVGQWERLQAEIAKERASIKAELEKQAKRRETITTIIVLPIALAVIAGGVGLLLTYLKG